MTYKELVAELEAAKVPEDAAGVVLAMMTEAYEEGYAAGTRDSFPTAHMDADKPAGLPKPDPALNAYMG